MGMVMSLMGKGVPSISMVTDPLYKQFADRNIKEFEDFHIAILDIFTTFNAALPGMHYDAPPREVVESYFDKWSKTLHEISSTEEKEAKRKQMFLDFMKKNITQSTLDETTLMMGLAAPPAAMAIKRAGENVPQLKMIKYIPDVIFVPTATLLTLVSMKLTRRVSIKEQITEVEEEPDTDTQ